MNRVRGFGKNYFTLAAIQAYSAESSHRRRAVSLQTRTLSRALSSIFRVGNEDRPPPRVRTTVSCHFPRHDAKPCHCDCFFRRRAWLLLHLSRLRKRPACRCRYTKTGLAPPF
ncbi:MAG: hypothetical protein GXO33_04940 [Epsilonproteobacteria bacterium]|nr:hypothetical protein [Campylobacterota bacterium]